MRKALTAVIFLLAFVCPAFAQPVGPGPVVPVSGVWTPTDTSGGTLTFTNPYGAYTIVNKLVTYDLTVTFPTTADINPTSIALPFTAAAKTNGFWVGTAFVNGGSINGYTSLVGGGASSVIVRDDVAGTSPVNSAFSARIVSIHGTYYLP